MEMHLREARERDAPFIQTIYAPIVVETSISFELEPPSVEEVARRIRVTLETHPWFVAEREGAILGYAYASPFRARAAYSRTAETTVYVGRETHRQGVGRTLMSALLESLSARGFHRAIAGVTLPNAPSVRLHEDLGYERVGVFREVGFKFGSWHDVAFFHRGL